MFGASQVLEPVAMATAASAGQNSGDIPNEDSQDFEFDDTSLLDPSRFPGLDRVQGGSSVAYGLRFGTYTGRQLISGLFGQAYSLDQDVQFDPATGLEDDLSDYVGRINLTPADWLDLRYRFRLDKSDLTYVRNEVEMVTGPPRVRFDLGYLMLEDDPALQSLREREEIRGGISLRLLDSLSLRLSTRYDLAEDRSISDQFGLFYIHPCLQLLAGVERLNTSDRDAEAHDHDFLPGHPQEPRRDRHGCRPDGGRLAIARTVQMRRLLIALGALSCLLRAGDPAGAQQRIVAVVNDDVISAQDLEDRLQLVTLTSGIPDSEEARARLAPQVLRSLIEEALQLQEAERLDITVEDTEIQRTLANIAERNQMTVEAMQRFFAQKGINLATLLDQVRAQIAWVKVVNRQIVPRVTVTVDQLDMAVEEARRSEGEPEYLLSEIVLPVDNPAQAQVVAQDAARLVQTLREGASFEFACPSGIGRSQCRECRRRGLDPQQRDPAGAARHLGGHARGRNLRSHLLARRLLHLPAARQTVELRRPRARRRARSKSISPRSCSRSTVRPPSMRRADRRPNCAAVLATARPWPTRLPS